MLPPRANALPLSGPQCSALLAAARRELAWGLRAVAREVRWWRARAERIPDAALRSDALAALSRKRGHADGAAMFCTLLPRRDPRLLRVLVRYELLQDFLDNVTEPGGALGPDGVELYRALGDAVDQTPRAVAYRRSAYARGDGGYLSELVRTCRADCVTLPGYRAVRSLLLRETERAGVLAINHQPAVVRDVTLRRWAGRQFPEASDLCWFEQCAAASGWITTHALLAQAASPRVTPASAAAVHAAYFPWLALCLTLIDSYVDRAEDACSGNHNYLSHYATPQDGVRRLHEAIDKAAQAVLALPGGERHAVLLGCMIALYLSKDAARTPELRATTAEIAAAGGTLTRVLLPVLRLWRVLNHQRSAT